MSAYSCFLPEISTRYWKAIQAGDMATLTELLTRTHQSLF